MIKMPLNWTKQFRPTLLIVFFLSFWASHSQSALIVQKFDGSVLITSPANPFGVQSGDRVSAIVTYESDLVSMIGESSVKIDENPNFHLAVNLGNRAFSEIEELEYGNGFPQVVFVNGLISGLNFYVEFGEAAVANVALSVFGTAFDVSDINSGELLVAGVFRPATTVAEPSTALALLIGFALLYRSRPARKLA
jgi:hypothetical protein